MTDPVILAHKAIRSAEKVSSGPKIQWTPEEESRKNKLEHELLRREHEKEIGPLDATSPQSMTDALRAYRDLYSARKAIHEAEAAAHDWNHPDMNPPVHQGIPGWRGEPCRDESHRGTVCDRCPNCGKRRE